uniref:Phosphatidate cytidylyltransferase n=1 Tax=Timspurckia oligopyrenoides TaxID=708627 RepID=A0A7S0ZCN5_9RHOD|mmetsp:Transcript_12667/g.22804  ORF Transcript_12667/g.22804 Transcript_12667/m.22804 type:complete len:440 (+) Transcript_12667:82-1401(+)
MSSTSTEIKPKVDSLDESKKESSTSAVESNGESKKKATKKADHNPRIIFTLIMMIGMLGILYCGHIAVCIFVVICGAMIFKEILALGFVKSKAVSPSGEGVPHFRTVNWGFYFTSLYFVFGKSILHHFDEMNAPFTQHSVYKYLIRHHSFLAFSMYVVFFLAFVMTLQPGCYKFQFGAFARSHVAIFLVLLSTNLMILNVKAGLIWFLLPCILVIVNDSFAYLVGRRYGKTMLVRVSPNKTVEGFVGGALCTLAFAFLAAWILSQMPLYYCPKPDFTDCGFVCRVVCEKPLIFVKQPVGIPPNLLRAIRDTFGADFQVEVVPMQLHALALAMFAAIIAPFGGFFASGLKRAFEVKDFADLIPGHGGVTDRMDCQLLMAVFTYVYTINFVQQHAPDVAKLMAMASELSMQEQQELLVEISLSLTRKGIDVAQLISNGFQS